MKKELLTVGVVLVMTTSLFAAAVDVNAIGDKENNRSWPPSHYDVAFLPRVNVVHLDDSNFSTQYHFLAGIPMSVFHYSGTVYQSLLISDDIDNPADKTTDYMVDDWAAYLDDWGGAQHINFIGEISDTKKNEILSTYNVSWEQVSNITGDPVSVANQIALHDWKSSDTVVIAPYVTAPSEGDIESISNAAVIASLYNAPLLFTHTSSLSSETLNVIDKLNAVSAILVEVNDSMDAAINSQLQSAGVSVSDDLTSETMVVSKIRSVTGHSTLCAILRNWQNLPASLSGARYGGYVLFLPDSITAMAERTKDIIENMRLSYYKLEKPEKLPDGYKSGEETIAQNFYNWLDTVGGNDSDDLETVITFSTQPYYDSTNGFSVTFDRAISGDPSDLTNPGAVTGRMPLHYLGNIALANRDGMYRATIFSNPRPYHVTLAMNAYEVWHAVGTGVDKWGENHVVNEIFGYPYRGWCTDNGNFPWQDIHNNTPDLSPILPPGPGDGPDCDPGQFASFNEFYEAHFHSGAYAGSGSHPAQPSVPNIGFVSDINAGSAFLYFSCHGGGTSIAVRNTDNGVAQDPSDMVPWGDDYWPSTDGRVYDGSGGGSYSQTDLDADLNNVHGSMTAYNACMMANGKMNEVLLEHGGSASFGSYTSVSFVGSGWWWNLFVHLITHENYTIGEAATYATARVAELYTPGANNGPGNVDDTLQYVVYGDPNVHFVQPDWTSPEPLAINVNYGGHQPDKPPHSFIVTINPDEIPIGVTSTVQVNVKDADTLLPLIANVSISGWGVSDGGQTNAGGNASFVITPPYGENLTLTVEKEDYDTYEGIITVTGGLALSGTITASVPSLGVQGVLAPSIEGMINGTSPTSSFTLAAKGCGIDMSVNTTTGSASMMVTPASVGTVHAALLKGGYRVMPQDISVLVLHLGISYSPPSLVVNQEQTVNVTVNCTESGTLIEGATVTISGCGMNETNVTDANGMTRLTVTPLVNGYATITVQRSGFADEETSILVTKANMTVETIGEMQVNQQLPVTVYVNNSFTGEPIDNATVSISGCGIGITNYVETGSLADGEHSYFDVIVGDGATYLSGNLVWDGSADIDMKLYDPNGNLVDSSTSTTPGEFVEATNPEAGTWQIDVYSYSGSTPSFTLNITIEYGTGVSGVTENGSVTLVIQPTSTGTMVVTAAKIGYNNGGTTINVVTGPTGNMEGIIIDSTTTAPLENVTVECYNSSVNPQENDPAFATATNASGHYLLSSMPAGEYTVCAWKFGYEPHSGVAEIYENDTTFYNITLLPAQTYVVQGNVTDSNTGALLWANITVYREDTGAEVTSVGAPTGHYTLNLIPYTYIFKVEAAQHLTLQETLQITGNTVHDFELMPALFLDTVESGENGWTHSAASGPDLWHITERDSHSSSHSWYCGYETGEYDDSMDDSLMTPLFNLTNYQSATLTFWHKYDFEGATNPYDGSDVEISVDGGTWEQLFPVGWYDDYIYGSGNAAFPSGTAVYAHSSNGWKEAEFDLTDYAGSDNVRIRFRFGSDGSVHSYEGWYIDDIAIYGEIAAPLPDLTIAEISFSDNEPWAGDTIFINATVANNGNKNASNVTVRFTDVTLESELIIGNVTIGSLAYGTQDIASIPWQAVGGYHIIKVEADPDGEIEEFYENNNVLTKEITVSSGNAPPTCEITAPPAYSAVNGTVTISGTASDADGTVQSVYVKIGEENWQVANGTTAWNLEWDTAGMANGFYDISAYSYDGEDISPVDSIVVTVDNCAGSYYIQWSHNYGSSISDARYQGPQPIGDADNDGLNELLIGGRDGELHVMKWNAGTSTYEEQALLTEPGGSGDNPGGFAIGDVDNDGLNEIAVAWDYHFSAFEWNGAAYVQIGTTWVGDGTDNTYDCFIGDFDDDGNNEVVLADDPYSGNPEITVLSWSNSKGDFVEKAYWDYPGTATTPMAWVADVDNDGSNEIICVPGYDLVVLDWNGASFTATTVDTFSYETYACVCGDANGNGIPEIAVGLHSPDGYIYEWNGALYENIWSATWPGEEAVIEAVAIGDTDDDGYAEVGFGTDLVHLVQWNGTTYVEEATLPTAGMLAPLAIGDCDNDGKNEINAGNVDDAPYMEWVFKYRLDNPPTCNITYPVNGTTVSGTVNLTGNAFDADNDSLNIFVRIDSGEWTEAATGKGRASWTYEINTSQMETGLHTIYAGSFDGQRYSIISHVDVFVSNGVAITIHLYTGWNLITVPVENSYNASDLAALIPGCTMLAWWNAASGTYTTFIVGITPPGSPWDFAIDDGIGYYVKVSNDTVLSLNGTSLGNVSVSLYPGWNTIGWWKDVPTTASSLAGNISSCTMLAMWDAETGTYTTFIVGITPPGSPWDFTVERGMGIFAKVTSGSVWHGEG